MICKHCGTELPDTAKFCASCGNSVIDDAPAVENAAPAASAEVSEASSSAVLKPLKSRKLPLILGIAGGSVAVVGAVAALIIANQASVNRVFMGKEDYAKSVLMDSIGFVGSNAKAFADSLGSSEVDLEALLEDLDDEEAAIASLALANSLLGVDGISVTAGMDIRPSEEIYDFIENSAGGKLENEELTALVQRLNETSACFTEKTGKDAYEFSFDVDSGTSRLMDAQLYYDADGDAYISFPDASDGAILVELPDIPELPEATGSDGLKLDYGELKLICGQLEEIFDEYYDEADVSVEKSTLKIDGAKFEGLCSEIVFEAEDMHDMLEDMIDVLEDSDYLSDLIEDNIDGADYDDLIDELRDFIYGLDKSEVEFSFKGYVTKTNKLAGIDISVYDDDDKMAVCAMNTSDYLAAGFVIESAPDDVVEATFVAAKETKDSGTAELKIKANARKYSLNFEYSGVRIRKILGQETVVGTFRLILDKKFAGDIGLDDSEVEFNGKTYTYSEIFDSMVITLSLSPDGKGLRCDASVDCIPFGYYGAYAVVKPASGKVALGKFSTDKVVDIEDIADDEGVEMVEDAVEFYADKIFGIPAFADILEKAHIKDADDLFEAFCDGYSVEEYLEYNFG